MNPFTQDINRILNDKSIAVQSNPDSSTSGFVEKSDSFLPDQPVKTVSATNRIEQISLQDISNGFELQSRRYDRFLSTDS